MRVKVINIFVDKNTKERYKLNQKLEVTKERYEEIKKYVEIIKHTKKEDRVEE